MTRVYRNRIEALPQSPGPARGATRPFLLLGNGEWPELVLATSPSCFSIKSQSPGPSQPAPPSLLFLFASPQALSWPKPSHSLVQSASIPHGPVWPGAVAPAPVSLASAPVSLAPTPVSSAPKLLWVWLLCSTHPDQASAWQGGGAGSGHGPRVQ